VINASLTIRRGLLVALLATGLAACSSDMDDLDQYINEVKAKPGGRIEPLPEITPYEIFAYRADAEGVRSPFIPDSPQITGTPGGVKPPTERVPEFLESFFAIAKIVKIWHPWCAPIFATFAMFTILTRTALRSGWPSKPKTPTSTRRSK